MALTGYFPENIGVFTQIDSVFDLIFYLVFPWLVLTEFIVVGFAVFYRKKASPKATYEPGIRLKALSWILVPAVVVLGFDLYMDYAGASVWHHMKEQIPTDGLTVGVEGKQFAWTFTLPGADQVLNTADDIKIENDLHVPADKNIIFELQSNDVIHSFFIPNIRIKQDVVPGRRIRGWFQAKKPGRYEIACAELCGIGHTRMRGWLNVHEPGEYETWLKETMQKQNAEDSWL